MSPYDDHIRAIQDALERQADALERIAAALEPASPKPRHADDIRPRLIGYTSFECERDMRRMTDGQLGCANPDEHDYGS